MMNYKNLLVFAVATLSLSAQARDDKMMFDVKAPLKVATDAQKIDGSVKFYFGDSKHPKASKDLGFIKTNKKTNAFGKSDQEACDWVFQSAIIALHNAAKKKGANAVINIESNYRNIPVKNDTQYQCGAGTFVAGVALKGTMVTL